MKRVLFWITFIPFGMILVTTLLLAELTSRFVQWVADKVDNAASRYEGWCFDYKKHGWKYEKNGLWTRSWSSKK